MVFNYYLTSSVIVRSPTRFVINTIMPTKTYNKTGVIIPRFIMKKFCYYDGGYLIMFINKSGFTMSEVQIIKWYTVCFLNDSQLTSQQNCGTNPLTGKKHIETTLVHLWLTN